ncbi:MAG: hypothetical protein MJ166_02310 [Clostridia bacterium]|nr:hypothetical protein [Clostridia bacterium]
MAKKSNGISGIVMIGLFLALFYAKDNIEWFQKFDNTTRGIIVLAIAFVLFLIVQFGMNSRNGNIKGLILQNGILLAAAAVFVVIALLISKAGVSENAMLIPWIGIPVFLMIIQTAPVKRFLAKLFTRKSDREE